MAFVDLLISIFPPEPLDRPVASVALARIQSIHGDLSPEILGAKGSDLPRPLGFRYGDLDVLLPGDGHLSAVSALSTSQPLSKEI